jgi:hypothetical protein
MIDILLVNQQSPVKIKKFLSLVFDCPAEKIKILELDEFNSLTEELDKSALDCVCVHSRVRGDVSQLLQLYSYKIPNSDVIKKIIDIAFESSVPCYIPDDSLDGWTYAGDEHVPRHAHQLECDEDDCFLFRLA